MNIFMLDEDPELAAQFMVNKHVVKMITESNQILSTAHRMLDGIDRKLPDEREELLYKVTHVNHPSVKWIMESRSNYAWLVRHLNGLLKEYTHRYGKIHKGQTIFEYVKYYPTNLLNENPTPMKLAMPEEYHSNNAVMSYRQYYINEKKHLFAWKNREKPEWIPE